MRRGCEGPGSWQRGRGPARETPGLEAMIQHEITETTPLLDRDGNLVQQGYARRLLLEYNREKIKAGWHRIKEWDYYAVLTPEYGVAAVVADLGLFGGADLVFLDFRNRTFICDQVFRPLTRGRLNLPLTSEEGDICIKGRKMELLFQRNPDHRRLSWRFPGFNRGQGMEAELVLGQPPEMDTMVIATSWPEKRTAFYYNQKVNCMPAEGHVRLGGNTYGFNRDNRAYAVLDWGRGVWTYQNTWYWGSLSGEIGGRSFGWNIGYGFSDRTPASENMLFYDGRAHKLEEVTFHIPTRGGKEDYLSPWTFTSSDGRFEMAFTPVLDRSADINLLVMRSDAHQVFGFFTGTAILDDGTKLAVDNLFGFAEKVFNRW